MVRSKKGVYFQKAKEPDAVDLYIYGDIIGDDYFDLSTGELVKSETSADHFRRELGKYQDLKRINLHIRSYGGSFFEGAAIYCLLRRHEAEKVVHIDGFVCSAAATVAMAGDRIIMPGNSQMFIHNLWGTVTGNAKELRKAADEMDTLMGVNRQVYLQKSGGKITEAKLIELLDKETWLTAEQCLTYGLADEVSSEKADPALAKQVKQAKQRMAKARQLVRGTIADSATLATLAKDFKEAVKVNPRSRQRMAKMMAMVEATEKDVKKELRKKWY